MGDIKDLNRFLIAQRVDYENALAEVKAGRKTSHWMWYIFPQIQGLGFSETSRFYAIQHLEEARAYLSHPILGTRLIEISNVLLQNGNTSARQIFGSPDDMKLKSCMSLFASLDETDAVFQEVLDAFFGGAKDEQTVRLINKTRT
jgi:uncharacterized protein (DUF1810 family)